MFLVCLFVWLVVVFCILIYILFFGVGGGVRRLGVEGNNSVFIISLHIQSIP